MQDLSQCYWASVGGGNAQDTVTGSFTYSGGDAAQCRADLFQGAGLGGLLGGSIGAALGPAGAAIGALVGVLGGGAVAASEASTCQRSGSPTSSPGGGTGDTGLGAAQAGLSYYLAQD